MVNSVDILSVCIHIHTHIYVKMHIYINLSCFLSKEIFIFLEWLILSKNKCKNLI